MTKTVKNYEKWKCFKIKQSIKKVESKNVCLTQTILIFEHFEHVDFKLKKVKKFSKSIIFTLWQYNIPLSLIVCIFKFFC